MLSLCLITLPGKGCELCIPIWTTIGVCGHAAPVFYVTYSRTVMMVGISSS